MSYRTLLIALSGLVVTVLSTLPMRAASYRTANFVVTADDAETAEQIGQAAERARKELAVSWLGKELPRWPRPCPVRAEVGRSHAPQGMTSYRFKDRRPVEWEMRITGPEHVVLHSVVPHEVMHTVLATHFGRALPRWAEEGLCTLVEDSQERALHQRAVSRILTGRRDLPLERLFTTETYPRDPIPFYMQSYSLSEFLVQYGGRQRFVKFVGQLDNDTDGSAIVRRYYGYSDFTQLRRAWLTWHREQAQRFRR